MASIADEMKEALGETTAALRNLFNARNSPSIETATEEFDAATKKLGGVVERWVESVFSAKQDAAADADPVPKPESILDPEYERQLLIFTLKATTDELAKHGWGDFHYGNTGQDKAVVDAVTEARRVLALVRP